MGGGKGKIPPKKNYFNSKDHKIEIEFPIYNNFAYSRINNT